jgi:hypothetical protein
VLSAIIAVLMIAYGVWLRSVINQQLKSKDSAIEALEAALTLCKVLCHNLVVLIHEMCELGIDPVFWPSCAK